MSRRTSLWVIPAVLYAAFCFWYTNTEGPMTSDEIEAVLERATDGGAADERIAQLREFMESDDGGQFLMFNTQFDGFHEVEVNGEKHTLPMPVENTHIYVYTVDGKRLDPDLLSPSFDHAPGFYQADTESYWYDGVIPPEHVNLTYQFDLEKVHDEVGI